MSTGTMDVDDSRHKKYSLALKYRLDGSDVKHFKGKLSMFPLPYKYTATKESFYTWENVNPETSKPFHENTNKWVDVPKWSKTFTINGTALKN